MRHRIMLGTVPAIVIGGGNPAMDHYEGLGFSIHDITHALSHLHQQLVKHLLPKPLQKVDAKITQQLQKVEHQVNVNFQGLKHWAQQHRKVLQIVVAAVLTMGAAAYLYAGAAAFTSFGAFMSAAGSGISAGASWAGAHLGISTAGHALATQAVLVLAQKAFTKQQAGQQLTQQESEALQQAQMAYQQGPGAITSQMQSGQSYGGGDAASYGSAPQAFGIGTDAAMPQGSSGGVPQTAAPSHSSALPLMLAGGGLLLFLMMR